MRKLLLLLIGLMFFAFPVSASWNNFNDGAVDIAAWTLVGSWNVKIGSLDGTNYSNADYTFGLRTMYRSTSIQVRYFSVDTRAYMGSDGIPYVNFLFQKNSTDSRGISIDENGVLTGVGFTYTGVGFSESNWFRVQGTVIGSNIEMKIYNSSLSLIDVQIVPFTSIQAQDSIEFQAESKSGGAEGYMNASIDNVVVSAVSPSASNSITWSAPDYIEGAAQTWNYAITDASWSDGSIKYVELYKDGTIITPWTSCTLGICYDASYMTLQGQTGSQPLHLTAGVYTIYLKTGLFVGHTILSQASMTVYATAPSQMIVNSSYPSRIPFNIWLSTGYSHATGQIRIDIEMKQGGDWILQRTFVITSDPGYNSIWVNAPGEYRVTLFDLTFGLKLITKYFSAVYVDVPIESNISTSNLTIEKTTFYYGDQLVGYYAIDNNNWTNGNTPYIAIRNTTSGIISAVYKVVVESQQKRFILGISDGNELPTNRYRPGNNTIELRAFNTTGDRLLDFKYFELADTDQDGNKLRLDKYKYCPNDKVLILASIPLQGYLTIANYNDLSRLLYNQSINGTDQSIVYKTKTPGNYLIRMLDYSGKQLRSADFVISEDCVAATATPTPATGTVAGQEAASLLSSKMFWAFMIIVGVMMFIVSKTKEYIPAGIAGITGLGIFTFMGWVPASIFFSVIVVTAYLLAKNQSKSETG